MASFNTILATFTALATVGHGHMFLTNPRPFDVEAGINAPISGPGVSGSEGSVTFPCQVQNYDFSFQRTKIQIGTDYNLTLAGTAVHGGGSCQLSLTTDLAPSASSDWHVFHSIQGGCPARNTPGNLEDGGADTPDPFQYTFQIPSTVPAGQYTFAWTWFNHVGNREMYMHCSPIEVDAPANQNATAQNGLASMPKMFLANIPGVPCSTSYTGELKLPDPGVSVETNADPDFGPPQPPVVAGGGSLAQCYAPLNGTSANSTAPSASLLSASAVMHASTAAVSASSVMASSTATLSASSTSTASTSSYAASSQMSSSVGVPLSYSATTFTTSSITAAMPVATSYTQSSAPTVSMPPSTSTMGAGSGTGTGDGAAPTATSIASNSNSNACPSGQVTCDPSSIVVCIGSNQFGLCNNGCAIPQDLAAGTECSNGVIARRWMSRVRGGTWW